MFVRGAIEKAEGDPDPVAQGSVNRARAKAKYRSHQLRAEIEVEFAGKARLKNAYADLRLYDAGTKVDVKVGNFKVPFSAIQLDSLWTLPLADRGLLDNVIVNRLQLAGREVGAMIDIEGAGDLQPELRAGVFQGTDDAGNPLAVAASDRFGQNAIVRLSLRPAHGLELGASASARVGAKIELPLVVRRGYASELDVTLDVPAGPGQLRAWLEAMVGTSWIVGGTDPSHELTRFTEARGIAAWRFGRRERRARFFEIYFLAGALDPDRTFTGDRVLELTGGITYGANDVWSIQAEAEVWRIGDQAPLGIAEFAVAPSDTTNFLLQLGARF